MMKRFACLKKRPVASPASGRFIYNHLSIAFIFAPFNNHSNSILTIII